MVLVRLAYVADLPSPADIIRALDGAPGAAAPPAARVNHGPASLGNNGGGNNGGGGTNGGGGATSAVGSLAMREAAAPTPSASLPQPQSFLQVVELFEKSHEALLRAHLYAHVHIVHFETGRIELRPDESAPRDLPNKLGSLLAQWTGQRWVVSVSSEPGEPTLKEQAEARAQSMKSEAARDPLVRAVLDAFPGARIESVRETVTAPAEPVPDADELPEGDDAL
jgi:DNA polymerase III subunit gamma/tau